ncbi:MAG: MFS transporter [Candidatus Thorarchaeota archaeon]|nr:MFS transporter [Candidatus Thorarchaeota archaeon]
MATITKASYAVLAACTIAHFLNHIFTGALSPFLPVIKEELSLNLTQVGIISSAAIVTMTITHLLVGYLADKGWRDIFIPLSVLLASIVVLFTSFATTFVILVIMQSLLGVGAAGYHPSAFPAISDRFPKGARAKAVGTQAMGGLVGMASIPFLGVVLLVTLGTWQASLIALGILGLILFVVTAMLMRFSFEYTRNNPEIEEEPDGEEGWTRNYVLAMILSGLRGIPFRCTNLLMPVYLVMSYGYAPLWAGSLTTLMLGTGLVGELISGAVSDRVQRRTPFIILSPLLMAPAILLLNFSLEPIPLVLVLMTIGFVYYFGVPPYQAYQTEISPRNQKGLAFGLIFSIGAIPGALSPIAFGWIGDTYGLSASILFLVIVSIMAAIVAMTLREQPHDKQDSTVKDIQVEPI